MPKYVKSQFNTRIPCICTVRSAYIKYKDCIVGTISEEKNDAGEFDWVIKVFWDAWEACGAPPIAGIDMDLRLDEYIRNGVIPAFVDQRTLPDDRRNIRKVLKKLGLRYNDRFEYMCRTHGICGPSRYTVERIEEPIEPPKEQEESLE